MNPKPFNMVHLVPKVCLQPNGEWSISLRVLPESDEEFITGEEATDANVQKLKDWVVFFFVFPLSL